MQKRTLIISGLFMAPAIVMAEGTSAVKPAQEIVAKVLDDASQQGSENQSRMQDHVITLMEDDFAFEKQRKKLSNELVLEKLRSDIRKLKGEGSRMAAPSVPSGNQAVTESTDTDEQSVSVNAPALRALLISEIAGQKRVAVTGEGGGIKMVPLNQRFSYAGYNYIAQYVSGDIVNIKEASR